MDLTAFPQDHRDRLVTYAQCFIASELVDWLLSCGYVKKRQQVQRVEMMLVQHEILVGVWQYQHFFDFEVALIFPP